MKLRNFLTISFNFLMFQCECASSGTGGFFRQFTGCFSCSTSTHTNEKRFMQSNLFIQSQNISQALMSLQISIFEEKKNYQKFKFVKFLIFLSSCRGRDNLLAKETCILCRKIAYGHEALIQILTNSIKRYNGTEVVKTENQQNS